MQTSNGREYVVGKGTEARVNISMIVIVGDIGEGNAIKADIAFLTCIDDTEVEGS